MTEAFSVYGDLYSLITSASFVLYLIENFGEELYAQVHFDTRNFEDVYGMSLYEMILEWRRFLANFGNEVALLVR